MGLGVFSLYWDNIDERFPYCQKTVMNHFGLDVIQHKIHGFTHSDWMDWVLTYPGFRNISVFLFLDIDCFTRLTMQGTLMQCCDPSRPILCCVPFG